MTCKTSGGKNHILYLYSSVCGCKGLRGGGGYLQPLHTQGRTHVLNLKIDHIIKINEADNLNKLVAHFSAMSNRNSQEWELFVGFCLVGWLVGFFHM